MTFKDYTNKSRIQPSEAEKEEILKTAETEFIRRIDASKLDEKVVARNSLAALQAFETEILERMDKSGVTNFDNRLHELSHIEIDVDINMNLFESFPHVDKKYKLAMMNLNRKEKNYFHALR